MFARFGTLSLIAAVASSTTFIGDKVQAKCSGSGRGGGSLGQSNATLSSSNSLYSNANAFAHQ